MTKAEYAGNGGCPQRDSTECEGYAGVRSAVLPESEERAGRGPELLEKILDRDNLNRGYKRVKANKGALGDMKEARGRHETPENRARNQFSKI